jgi:hypothetical protein
MAHQVRGWCNYIPSNSNIYNAAVAIKCDAATAANNGGAALSRAPNIQVFWPGHRSDMRAAYGVDTAAPQYKDVCIALTPIGQPFNLGQSFTDSNGNVYLVNGLRAERVRLRNFK